MQQIVIIISSLTIGALLGFGVHGLLIKPQEPCARFYVELLDETDEKELLDYLAKNPSK